jgi:hypothetical protein
MPLAILEKVAKWGKLAKVDDDPVAIFFARVFLFFIFSFASPGPMPLL